MDIKTFVFIDCETVGAKERFITELCFTVIESKVINKRVFPSIQNKLNLYFTPSKVKKRGRSNVAGKIIIYQLFIITVILFQN